MMRNRNLESLMTPYLEKLLPLCEELGQTALAIAGQVELKLTEHKLLDPNLLAVALLSRTLGNFRGAVRLAEQGLLVEARVLTRCCFENVLLIGGLYSEGIEFARKIRDDDVAGKKNRLQFVMDNNAIFGSLSEETREELAKAQQAMQATAKSQYLRYKEASRIGPFKEIYLAYSQYSGDAAHPTFTALMRHVNIEDSTAEFDIVPTPSDFQLDETVHLACVAMIGAAVAANEMCGYTDAGKRLPDLNAKLKSLQAEKFGEKTLGGGDENLEIRTELPKDKGA
jgi:hypothetical protein